MLGVHDTHYGPAGHAPFAARRLKIGIHAEITEDFPDDIRCGYLQGEGRALPPKGPLKNAPIAWSVTGDFEQHFDRGNAPKRTDASGNAMAEFGVKAERLKGFGRVVKREGAILAAVSPGPSSASVEISQAWGVEFHKPRGFKFSASISITGTTPEGDQVRLDYQQSGRACGDDPYASQAWTIRDVAIMTANGVPIPITDLTYPLTFRQGVPVTGPYRSYELLVDSAPDLGVRLQLTPPPIEATWDPPSIDRTFPVTEDTSCPEN